MHDDDFVPPSDADELEEIQSATDDYWNSATSTFKRNLAALWLDPSRSVTESKSQVSADTRTLLGSPTRKRRKLSHSPPTPNRQHGDVSLHERSILGMTSGLDPAQALDARTPTTPSRHEMTPATTFAPLHATTPNIPLSASCTPGLTFSGPVDYNKDTQSRESSADPLLIFTPSRRQSKPQFSSGKPPRAFGAVQRTAEQPEGDDAGLLRHKLSSPLTPMRSMTKSPSARSPLGGFRSPDSRHSPSHNDSVASSFEAATSAHEEGPEVVDYAGLDEPRRYAMRARNARQLNPYVYDKISYKKQLRNIPEAIVLARSPRRHRREVTSSQDLLQSSDPEVDPDTLQIEESDDGRRGRRKSRSGAIHSSSPSLEGPSNPEVMEAAQRWYPAAFDLSLSSDSESHGPSGVGAKARSTLQRRKRRPKVFPMTEKQLGKQPARQTNEVLLTQQRRALPVRDIAVSSDDEAEVVANSPNTRPPPASDRWSDDHRGGVLGHHMRNSVGVPPTSSSVGRSSDVEIYAQEVPLAPLSPAPGHDESRTARSLSADRSSHITPPQTDNDSANEQSSSSNSDGGSQDEIRMSRRERKALERMMPRSMVLKHLLHPPPKSRARQARVDGPTTAGHVRTRVAANPRDVVDIKGDSESSDSDRLSTPHSPSGYSPGPTDRHPHDLVGKRRQQSVIDVTSSSDESTDTDGPLEDEVGDEEVNEWMWNPQRWRETRQGKARERTLVDYMLAGNRTAGGKSRKNPARKNQRHRRNDKPKLSRTGFAIDVGGSRKHDSHRQTRIHDHLSHSRSEDLIGNNGEISDPIARSPRHKDSSGEMRNAFEIMKNAARSKHRKTKAAPAGLYVFQGNGRVASGRAHANVISVDAEDNFSARRPTNFIPSVRHRKKRRRRATSSTGIQIAADGTLEDCWDHPSSQHDPQSPSVPAVSGPRISRRVEVGAGISSLPVGITFAPTTFLGKGLLSDILSSGSSIAEFPPAAGYIDGAAFSHTTPVRDFVDIVNEQFDRVFAKLSQGVNIIEDEHKEWIRFFRACCQHITWFSRRNDETQTLLRDIMLRVLTGACNLAEDDALAKQEIAPDLHQLALETLWATVEMAYRAQLEEARWSNVLALLMRHLWRAGLHDTFLCVANPSGSASLDYSEPRVRLAEIWICLVHLLRTRDGTNAKTGFWDIFRQARELCPEFKLDDNPSHASEVCWEAIFILCAFSQFSVRGVTTSVPQLPASWRLVEFVMSLVPTMHDPLMPKAAQIQRDKYIRILVQRCTHLHQHWQWGLHEAAPMFNQIYKIFQSRQFGNLLHEKPDFPNFLCDADLNLLFSHSPSDNAFISLLKLVVQAAGSSLQAMNQTTAKSLPLTVRRLLALLIPVGSMHLDKAAEATIRGSSMLHNRLSAVAVALTLELSPVTTKNRVTQASRYVDFKEANMGTRYACIRGAMYIASVLRHFHLPLEEAMTWLASMTDTLVDEFRALDTVSTGERGPGQHRVALCIQMLLGSVRCLIETGCMDKRSPSAIYPDPTLLNGPWITRIFSSSFGLHTIPTTRDEIQRLVIAFLEARSKVIPKPARPRREQPSVEEESQEYYAGFDQIDFDDPELAAALDESPETLKIKSYEEDACKLISKDIWPAVHRFTCMSLNELDVGESLEISSNTSCWIQCWVRCASILVQNGHREWPWFFQVGIPAASEAKQPMRLKVALSFKFSILEWDPHAYTSYKEIFLAAALQALSSHQVTFEHEYVTLVIALDGLQHPLLSGLPVELSGPSGELKLSKADFLNAREDILDHMFCTLELSFKKEAGSDYVLKDLNSLFLGLITTMFTTMKEIYQDLHITEKVRYVVFCRSVFESFSKHPSLVWQTQGHEALTWLTQVASSS